MANLPTNCPECGAAWHDGSTCQSYFHQMLAWEWEYPDLQAVHHLMVLSYHLQHPSLYSPAGLAFGIELLREFVEQGLSTEDVRQLHRRNVDSGHREWKIKGTPAVHGSYPHPVQWNITAAEIVAGGHERYCDLVEQWARSILDTLKASGNYPLGQVGDSRSGPGSRLGIQRPK